MSAAAIQTIRDMFECFNSKDVNRLSGLLTDRVKHTAQGSEFGVEVEGRENYVEYMAGVISNFESLAFDPYGIHFDKATNTAIAEWRSDFVTAKGKPYSSNGVIVIELVDDKISWVREYFDTEKTKLAMSET